MGVELMGIRLQAKHYSKKITFTQDIDAGWRFIFLSISGPADAI